MNANDLAPKELISSADVFDAKGKPTSRSATISRVIEKLLVGQGDDKELRPALAFEGTDRKLVLNKTNIGSLVEFFGGETDDWIGQKVSLIGDFTQYAGKTVKALRIRPDDGKGSPIAEHAATPAFDPDKVEIPF